MSASGKSSNRLREYRRGRSTGTGHGIYAEAGKRDRKAAQEREQSRVTPPAVSEDNPTIHEPGCGWETGPYCTCGADPEREEEDNGD